jgi:hypothetical protein
MHPERRSAPKNIKGAVNFQFIFYEVPMGFLQIVESVLWKIE